MNVVNKIDCKDLCVFTLLTFFTGIWCIYNCLIRKDVNNKSYFNSRSIIDIPKSMQFLFPYIVDNKLLYQKYINMWALGHTITYFVTGLVVPNRYKFIILMSLLCEFYESKLSDLFVNTFSYLVGSQITIKYFREYGEKVCKDPKLFYYTIPICITFLLLLSICKKR